MNLIPFILGAIFGGLAGSGGTVITGVLMGGLIGYLLARVTDLQHNINSLEARLSPRDEKREPIPAPERQQEPTAPPPKPQPAWAPEPTPPPSARFDPESEAISWETSYEPEPRRRELPPSPPSPVVEALREFFTGGNLLVKVGVVILFFGVSFLAKYAADRGLVPVEFRLCGIALGGIALLAAGWRLRERRASYALALQGGGVGILFLTIFAAFRLYSLLPASLTFGLLVAVCALSSCLAVLQNSRTLAVLGISGGFLAPILASTGSGNHVALFSYYAVLNAGIFGIAWFRSWRVLNLVGFAFTFVIGIAWGVTSYTPDRFATTEPFLILFFVMYTLVALLFALRQAPDLKGYVDATLVFGTPIVCTALQATLVSRYQYGLAWSALGLGFYYILLANVVFTRHRDELRLLAESFLAFGVVFATVAIPLALDGRWSAAAWSVEGAAMVWAGIRQQRWQVRLFGLLLLVGGGILFAFDFPGKGPWPVANAFWLGTLLIAAGALISSYLLQRAQAKLREWETLYAPLLLAWGLLWWYTGGVQEIWRWLDESSLAACLGLAAVTSWICGAVANRMRWNDLRVPALLLLPAMAAALGYQVLSTTHPSAHWGWLAWPVAFALHYLLLYENEERWESFLPFLHAPPAWFLAGLCAWEANWCIGRLEALPQTWRLLSWGLVPSLVLLGITDGYRRLSWPLARHRRTYLVDASLPLALVTMGWVVFMNVKSSGDPTPLPYLPLLNPLDLSVGIVSAIAAAWYLNVRREEPAALREFSALAAPLLGGVLFLWLNGIVVRTVHHWGGVSFTFDAMYRSFVFQAAISLTWCITAFCAMTMATRRLFRPLWVTGAVLLGGVVLKLFVVDLSGRGTVERIVSFVGVGLLLLAIGWFSPVPPKQGKEVGK